MCALGPFQDFFQARHFGSADVHEDIVKRLIETASGLRSVRQFPIAAPGKTRREVSCRPTKTSIGMCFGSVKSKGLVSSQTNAFFVPVPTRDRLHPIQNQPRGQARDNARSERQGSSRPLRRANANKINVGLNQPSVATQGCDPLHNLTDLLAPYRAAPTVASELGCGRGAARYRSTLAISGGSLGGSPGNFIEPHAWTTEVQ